MAPIKIRIRRAPSVQDLPSPAYMSESASGMDLYAANEQSIDIRPGDVTAVPTGLSIEIPPGYEGQVRMRSGLALRHGLCLPNAPGTIDADYRGHVQIIVGNIGQAVFRIERGMRIAQLVICPVVKAQVEFVAELEATSRGDGGFGHTGLT